MRCPSLILADAFLHDLPYPAIYSSEAGTVVRPQVCCGVVSQQFNDLVHTYNVPDPAGMCKSHQQWTTVWTAQHHDNMHHSLSPLLRDNQTSPESGDSS